jgi:NADH:ubiquinone oxidoreductase subunit 6 (subunit J)
MNYTKILSAALVMVLAALMISVFLRTSWPAAEPDQFTSEDLGGKLFGTLTDPGFSPIMIMIAVMLLVALLGAVFLAKEEEGGK